MTTKNDRVDRARKLADDINLRVSPAGSPIVSDDTEDVYRSMPRAALLDLRVAFTLDAESNAATSTRVFCASRIALINRILGDGQHA